MKPNRMWLVLVALTLVVAACGRSETTQPVDESITVVTEPLADSDAAGSETTVAAESGTEDAETTDTTEAQAAETSEEEETIELVIWADETRANVIQEIGTAFQEATGVGVVIQTTELSEIRSQIQVAAPAGEGPDIFVGSGEWTGELVANELIAPVDLDSRATEFETVALEMFSLDGTLFALPYSTETIAMYYNADLVTDVPTTMDEVALACQELPAIENCIGLPGGGTVADAFHNFPFIASQGGGIFAYDRSTGYDGSTVQLDSSETIAGVQTLAALVDEGIVRSVDYEAAKALFYEQKQPFWITGPWELGPLNDSDLNWGVTTIPRVDGTTPPPLVGGLGFFVSAHAEHAVIAETFLLDYVATQETMQALFEADPRPPAHKPTLAATSSDPAQAVFAASAATGLPRPNIPEMSSVWGPLGVNLLGVRNGEISPADAMTNAQEAIETALSG